MSRILAPRLASPAPHARRAAALCGVVMAVVLCAAIGPATSASAAPPPRGFFGIQAWDPLTSTDLDSLNRANVRVYRTLLLWHKVEPRRPEGDCSRSCRHRYSARGWQYYDAMFAKAARRGIRVLPVVMGSPRWAATKPQYQPESRSAKRAFRDFARAAAHRYGPQGTLWSRYPWSSSRPAPLSVRSVYWQVWNEPNISNYWRGGPNPSGYASMLKGVSRSLKGASRDVRVVAAGLPWPAVGIRADTFLWRMLAIPGVAPAIDVVAIHPYARYLVSPWYGQEDVMDHVRQARDVMRSRGVGSKRMWITEIGWASGTPDGRFTVSHEQQRRNLDELYRRLLRVRRSYNLIGVAWFSDRDKRPGRGERWYWGFRSGLLFGDRSPKPAWRTFRARALHGY